MTRLPPLRPAFVLALALLLSASTPAWAHATYVLDAWLEPERPDSGQSVTLTVEMLDHRGAPVRDHQLRAEVRGGGEEALRVALPEARAGVYTADLPARPGDWAIDVVDLTHVREERLTTVQVAAGGDAPGRSQPTTSAADAGAEGTPEAGMAWRWIAAITALALFAGLLATVWAVRRSDSEAP